MKNNTANLRIFLKELEEDFDTLFKKIQKVEKDIVSEIMQALMEPKEVGGTPVKTGWLKGNWVISLNSIRTDVVGNRDSSSGVNEANRARDNAFKSFLNADLSNTKMIYLNNNVPYGVIVNSKQGFREGSIQRGLSRLNTEGKI